MADIFKAAEMMSEALQRELGDELDIVFQCGSMLNGNQHQYSDLDMLYVPKHESTWNCITVSIDGTMIDLFPMHWPTLEKMADFENISIGVLLKNRIVYQASEEAGKRFKALSDRVRANMGPEARRDMVARAMGIFQKTGYEYYLLKTHADSGDLRSCILLSERILKNIFLSLMAVNQKPIDSRKPEQLMSLPLLPEGFEKMLGEYKAAKEPIALLTSCEKIMSGVRELLLTEQRATQLTTSSFSQAMGSGYVELLAGLGHIFLACDRRNALSARTETMGLYWEWAKVLAEAFRGVAYSGFNSFTEMGIDLFEFGFPDLLPGAIDGNFEELRGQCQSFQEHMTKFTLEHGGNLYSFNTLESLKEYLDSRTRGKDNSD